MKRYKIVFCCLLMLSCVPQKQEVNIMTDNVQVDDDFPFAIEPLPTTLTKAFTNVMADNLLLEYNEKLQITLETEFDGKKIKFVTKDKALKVEFHLRESFKIVEKNIYCREYAQHVEYMNEVIDNIGVACRQKGENWENLVLLTQ